MQLVMKEFGRNVPVSDLQAALERLDANGDGKVDWEDFHTSLKSGRKNTPLYTLDLSPFLVMP